MAGLEHFAWAIYQCDRFHITRDLRRALAGQRERWHAAREALQASDLPALLRELDLALKGEKFPRRRERIKTAPACEPVLGIHTRLPGTAGRGGRPLLAGHGERRGPHIPLREPPYGTRAPVGQWLGGHADGPVPLPAGGPETGPARALAEPSGACGASGGGQRGLLPAAAGGSLVRSGRQAGSPAAFRTGQPRHGSYPAPHLRVTVVPGD